MPRRGALGVLNLGELDLLSGGEPLRRLEQRPTGALEPLAVAVLLLPSAFQLVRGTSLTASLANG
jgi:hypothetical protein